MTQEEKAKRYDEALIKAKNIVNSINVGLIGKDSFEAVFPELKENEDERIRKELLEHCINRRDGKQVCVDASDYRRWADWLFRQGVENITNIKSDKEISNEIIKFLELPHPQFVGKRHQEKWIAWLERQGEKKPTDKVELKFKDGDWVVYDHRTYQVVELPKEGYINLGLRGNGKIEFAPSTYCRHWTIQDAKDGDVLACNEEILLFKSYSVQGRISLYCWYNGQTNNFHSKEVDDASLTTRNKICPATKEQRDLLFQKMHEAGYEWDAEKKELKKIEQNNTDEYIEVKGLSEIEAEAEELTKEMSGEKHNFTDFERTLADICIGWIGEEPGWKEYIKDNADVLLKIAVKKFNSVQDAPFEQKPSWSEEDESIINDIEESLIAYKIIVMDNDMELANYIEKEINWLKSLKDRVQPILHRRHTIFDEII